MTYRYTPLNPHAGVITRGDKVWRARYLTPEEASATAAYERALAKAGRV